MSSIGATILGCAGPVLSPDEAAFFKQAQPWGFILFARNVETPDQVRRLTGALRGTVGREAPVFIDQEGGRVQRMWAPHWRNWRPALDHAAMARPGQVARSLYLRSRLIAGELRDLGIDGNCAPLGDIAHETTHPVLRNRCYGHAAAPVTEAARAVANGLLEGGVLPVLKHVPGHGRAQVDSHHDLPVVREALDVLEAQDFAPFRALADLPLAMTAHVVFEALDPTVPGTISPHVIGAIRNRIGFDGLLMTDDLSMNALPGTLAQRAQAALGAGCDIALHCNGLLQEMEAVVSRAGALSPRSEARAADALARRVVPEPADVPALEAELAQTMDGAVYV